MITLDANYSKKLGLPGYSSHQFSITLRSEIADLSKVQDESARLYQELQHAVDASIQQVGYLPGENGHGTGNGHNNGGNGHSNRNSRPTNGSEKWNCSDKQRDLIIKTTWINPTPEVEIRSLDFISTKETPRHF